MITILSNTPGLQTLHPGIYFKKSSSQKSSSRFIFILSFCDSYIISFIKLSNCFISKNKITAILFLSFLEPELQLCQAENLRIDLKTCIAYLFQSWLRGSTPHVLWSTKELTCEIECHMGANGYPGGKLYHSAQAGGQTDLIASLNWSKYLYLFLLDCQPYQEVGLQFTSTKTEYFQYSLY